MTRDPIRWSDPSSGVSPAMRALLDSVATDEPTAAQLDRMSAGLSAKLGTPLTAATTTATAMTSTATTAALTTTKLALVVVAVVAASVGVWRFTAGRSDEPAPAIARIEAPSSAAPPIPSPSTSASADVAPGQPSRGGATPSVAPLPRNDAHASATPTSGERAAPRVAAEASSPTAPRPNPRTTPSAASDGAPATTRDSSRTPPAPGTGDNAPLAEATAPRADAPAGTRDSSRTTPPASALTPTDEVSLLEAAQAALAADPGSALALAERHAQQFARGVLREEREAIAIEALVALDRVADARARFDRFAAAFPRSGYRVRLARRLDQKTQPAAPLHP